MKYDDASWHSGGDFPKDLPDSAAATHIAMFSAWGVLNGLAGEVHNSDSVDGLQRLNQRDLTPGEWFLQYCDGKLTAEDFNEQGNAFASAYYDKCFAEDYEDSVSKRSFFSLLSHKQLPSLYHVSDTWETYGLVEKKLSKRFIEWQKTRSPSR